MSSSQNLKTPQSSTSGPVSKNVGMVDQLNKIELGWNSQLKFCLDINYSESSQHSYIVIVNVIE